jgi:adenine-specific DNA-methyltransferase
MSGNLSRSENSEGSGANFFEIVTPSGRKWNRTWTVGKDEYDRLNLEGRIYFADGGNGVPRRKIFRTDTLEVTQSSIFQSLGSSQSGRRVIEELTGQTFSYPKPTELIARLCALTTCDDDIVLDFFAGSGTTAQAVMEQNAVDGGARRFILVQLPEPTPEESEAYQAGYRTISALTIERMKKAGLKIQDTLSGQAIDVGFRTYSLVDTNFTKWRVTSEISETQLEQQVLNLGESTADNALPEDVLVEILLKQGYSLSENIE